MLNQNDKVQPASPLVSAIMPTYNGARTLRQALDSVLSQNYKPMEVIVVDDTSTDETPHILADYGAAIHYVRRETNSGICPLVRGEAMRLAKGKYHAFIDQDDLWDPDKIARQVDFMEHHPDIPLCHTYMRVIDGSGNVLEVRHQGQIPPTGNCARELLQHCFITASAIMVKPDVWIGTKRVVGMQHSNTDTETFLHILQTHPAGIGFIPEVLGAYRRWPQSMSRKQWRWGPEDVNALERVYARGFWKGLLKEKEVLNALVGACVKNAEYYRHQARPGRALYYVWKGLRHSPWNRSLYRSGLKAAVRGFLGQGFALDP